MMQTFPSGLPATPLVLLAAALVGLAGCVTPRHPVPADLVEAATVPGYVADIRFWGDDAESISRAAIAAEAVESRGRTDTPDWFFLSISGGGSNGAFGAGLITGWTATGTRPEFDIVTGISTGSLAAPFAFLGPDWDDELTVGLHRRLRPRHLSARSDFSARSSAGAIEDNAPLRASGRPP